MSHGAAKGPGQGGPARGYSWPPFQPGNLAALRHGARSPRILAPIAEQLAAGLAQVAPWTSAASFQGTVASWAWAEAQAQVLRAWLDEHGLVDDGQPRPAARMLEGVEGRLALGRLLATLSQVDGDRGSQGLEALRRAGAELRAAADRRPVDGNGDRVAGELGGGGGGGGGG